MRLCVLAQGLVVGGCKAAIYHPNERKSAYGNGRDDYADGGVAVHTEACRSRVQEALDTSGYFSVSNATSASGNGGSEVGSEDYTTFRPEAEKTYVAYSGLLDG